MSSSAPTAASAPRARTHSTKFVFVTGGVVSSIGKGIVAREGSDVTLFAHGTTVAQALEAADALEKDGHITRLGRTYCELHLPHLKTQPDQP